MAAPLEGTAPDAMDFRSRRSPVFGTRGMVACTQPLAAEAGMRILQQGGNAADAAVAMAAALNVTEPCATGIGGDAFALWFSAKDKSVSAVLGCGRSPAGLTLDHVRAQGIAGLSLPSHSALTVTVPGAPALWEDVSRTYGTLPLSKLLQPAIELAEGGWPVSYTTAVVWEAYLPQIQRQGGLGAKAFSGEGGKAPRAGQLHRNPELAATFRCVAEHGAYAGFYQGRIAESIVAALRERGGVMQLSDLAAHRSTFTRPIQTSYRGFTVYEVPPPTQGIAALMALNILEQQPGLAASGWGSPDHLHASIEAMRLGFADALAHDADPEVVPVPVEQLLSKEYARQRRAAFFDPAKAATVRPGDPARERPDLGERRPGGDTVYFCVVDGEGNACSFINSNYEGFGSGIVPAGCGFTLQNRGHNFILQPGHPNCLAPCKRPYHTIIPALATDAQGELFAAFGVMGGFMQPQGHLQVLSNMLDFGMEPQAALDAPRWSLRGVDSCLGPASVRASEVFLEEGFPAETAEQLAARGHTVIPGVSGFQRALFGRGQVIRRNAATGVLWGGSEPRGDGQVLGW